MLLLWIRITVSLITITPSSNLNYNPKKPKIIKFSPIMCKTLVFTPTQSTILTSTLDPREISLEAAITLEEVTC